MCNQSCRLPLFVQAWNWDIFVRSNLQIKITRTLRCSGAENVNSGSRKSWRTHGALQSKSTAGAGVTTSGNEITLESRSQVPPPTKLGETHSAIPIYCAKSQQSLCAVWRSWCPGSCLFLCWGKNLLLGSNICWTGQRLRKKKKKVFLWT